jgi:hypothetical protein
MNALCVMLAVKQGLSIFRFFPEFDLGFLLSKHSCDLKKTFLLIASYTEIAKYSIPTGVQ